MNLTRREFFKWSGGLVLTTLSSPLLAACQNAVTSGESRGVATLAATGGSAREYKLSAAVTPIDLGTGEFKAWTYNGQPVGPEIRVTEGDTLRVILTNNLSEPTTIHWHGVPVPNAMDGVRICLCHPSSPAKSLLMNL